MRNLRQLGVREIFAIDPDAERLQPVIDELGVIPISRLSEARIMRPRPMYAGADRDKNQPLEVPMMPDIAVICSPPSLHARQCLEATTSGLHVFVEKPFATRLDDIDEIDDMAFEHGCYVQVGYNLRFIPALRELKDLVDRQALGRPLYARFEAGQYLPDWRPWQDYRQSYTARRELGGGIVMDGSHEIDLALWLLGTPSEVCCMAGHVSDLEMDVEDSATLLLQFKSGAQADVHVDCIQREYARGLKIAFERGTATWKWPENILRIFEVEKGERFVYPPQGYEANQMYVDEMKQFLTQAKTYDPRRTCVEGREVVRIALAALKSSEERRWISLEANS